MTDLQDILANTDHLDDCLIWRGWKNSDGYGYVRHEGRDRPAHRVVAELMYGGDLGSLEVDHLCRQRACVRPEHLDVVTHAENQRRLSLAQKSCRRSGHDWTDSRNVYVRKDGRRYCAECARLDDKRRRRVSA